MSMNEPPETEPLSAPEPQASPAPVITSLDEVLKPEALRRVNHWRRQCRRCLRMAALGNLRKAKSLRPQDMWLSAESSMQPGALEWNWDLRPLASGGEAVPFATSGVGGVEPATNLKLPFLRQLRKEAQAPGGFADKAIIDEMINGVNDDVQMERGSLLCAPHVSALANWEVAEERTSRNVSKGWSFEGELPCWPINVAPYGIVDESTRAGEAKWRLTNDLSWPHPGSLPDGKGGFVQSHNGAMDRSGWPPNKMMHVRGIAEAAAIMSCSGAPIQLWSADCDSFYRKMGRQSAQIWRNAMAVAAGFQVDERCCFGSAADATKCSRITNLLIEYSRKAMREVDEQYPVRDARVLEWQRQRAAHGESGELGVIGGYIDDMSGCSFADECVSVAGEPLMREGVPVLRSTLHFEALVRTLDLFGHQSKESKEQKPGDSIEVLGVHVNLTLGRMLLTDRKRKRYGKMVEEVLELNSMPRREWMRMMGRLQSAAQCFPRGRLWLNAAWRVGRACYRLGGDRVPLTRRVRKELGKWASELKSKAHEGVPLASRSGVRPSDEPGSGAIYADASGEIGWCAWTIANGELLGVLGEWSAAERDGLIIAEKELFASTVGLVTLAPAAGWRDVWSFTDNTVALSAMRTMAPSTTRMQELTSARVEWMAARGVREAAERISTHANLWADWGSRGRWDEVEAQAKQMGLPVKLLEPPEGWGSAAWMLRAEE